MRLPVGLDKGLILCTYLPGLFMTLIIFVKYGNIDEPFAGYLIAFWIGVPLYAGLLLDAIRHGFSFFIPKFRGRGLVMPLSSDDLKKLNKLKEPTASLIVSQCSLYFLAFESLFNIGMALLFTALFATVTVPPSGFGSFLWDHEVLLCLAGVLTCLLAQSFRLTRAEIVKQISEVS